MFDFEVGDKVTCIKVHTPNSRLSLGDWVVRKVYPYGSIEVHGLDGTAAWSADQFEYTKQSDTLLLDLMVRMYDATEYDSIIEADMENAVIDFALYGEYEAEGNQLLDVLRALIAKSSFTKPIAILFNDGNFYTTFHSIERLPF